MMKTIRILVLATTTAVAGVSVLGASAFAQSNDRISWSQLTKKLEDKGYHIRELDQKHEGWKADVIKDNQKLELRIDKQGNVVREQVDD